MSKLRDSVGVLVGFFTNVVAESKKATWPTRQELMQSTIVVIVSVVMIGLFVGLCDQVLLGLLRLLIQRGGS